MEKSLVIIKPDGVSKKVIGKIITCFENQDLNIEKIKMMKISRELACRHYYEHRDKDFFKQLLEYITSGNVAVMVISGYNAIKKVRDIMGPTDPKKAKTGTIRGDYGTNITVNVVHGSDSKESAVREIKLFFCE